MESAVSERRKAFDAAHRSDEDRQAYISASRHASSVIAKAEAWQTTCSSLTPKSVHSLLRYMLLLLLFTRPLPRDGGMAEDHEAPEAGQLSRVWTRGHKETESRQRVSGAKSP